MATGMLVAIPLEHAQPSSIACCSCHTCASEIQRLLGGQDTLRFALFLAMFIGGYKYLLCFLRHQRGVDDGLNTFIAGSISALALLFDQQQRRIAISMYLMTRTLQFTCSALSNAGYLPKIPHVDVLLMAVASAAILNAYIFAPDTLPVSLAHPLVLFTCSSVS